jgi:hypothetical protein
MRWAPEALRCQVATNLPSPLNTPPVHCVAGPSALLRHPQLAQRASLSRIASQIHVPPSPTADCTQLSSAQRASPRCFDRTIHGPPPGVTCEPVHTAACPTYYNTAVLDGLLSH